MNAIVDRSESPIRERPQPVVSEGSIKRDPFAAGARIGRLGVVTIAVLFGSGFLWLFLAPLNGAVVVPAQVMVENYRKSVQHLEGGIVRAVLVKSGDRVTKGQVLMQMEEVQADAAVENLSDQLDAEEARLSRASAERLMHPEIAYPAEILAAAAKSAKLKSLLNAETELFRARRKQWLGQSALLRNQTEQVRAEIAGLQEQISAANKNRKIIADELAMNVDLFHKGFVQQSRLMVFERALAEKDEKRGEYNAELAKAQQKVVELELRVMGLQDDYVKRASDEASDVNRQVLELQERLRPLRNALTRQAITAPIAGEVVDLRVHTAGAVIGPGDVLLDVVPEKPALIVEGKVRPEDVADLVVGQAVEVQITAFKQRSTPLFPGRLSYISADSMADHVNGVSVPYYLVQALVESKADADMPRRLVPGMPAVLFIQTRARTAMDYLLQPLSDSLRTAFREH